MNYLNRIKQDDLKRIHIVPYSHHDHAWTNTRQWHIWRYLEGFRLGLECMREHADYTFLVDNVLHSLEVMERYCPSMMPEFRQRAREGRICVSNGGLALVRPSNSGDELFLRNIINGRTELMERLECGPMLTFFNADTAVGHSQLPQILTLCGHKAYRSFRPEGTHDQLELPREILWEGLDGSRIVYTRGSYGGLMIGDCCEPGLPWEKARELFSKEELVSRLPLQQTCDLYLNLGCDDVFPLRNLFDKPIDVVGFMHRWNENEPSTIKFSTPDRYLEEMDQTSLPLVKGILDPCELSYNAPLRQADSLWFHRFETERNLTQLETVASIAGMNGVPCDWSRIRRLWRQLMQFSGHAMEFLLADDYADALDIARQTLIEVRQYTTDVSDRLASVTARLQPVQHLLINTIQYDGEQVVPLHITTPNHVRGFRLTDSSGRILPYQITDVYQGDKDYVDKEFNEVDLVCLVRVPSLGIESVALEFDGSSALAKAETDMQYLSCPVDPEPVEHERCILDNGVLRITIEDGVIRRVTLPDGNPIGPHDTENPFGVVRFFHTTPTLEWTTRYDDVAVDSFVCENSSYPERGPLRWRFDRKGHIGGRPARLSMTLLRNDPVISFELVFDNEGTEGYYTVGFPGRSDDIEAGIPFGVESRHIEDYIYSDSLKFEGSNYLFFERGCQGMFFARHFAAFEGVERGHLALLQGDCGVYFRARPKTASVELLLMKSFDWSRRTEKWVRKVGPSLMGKGAQTFHFGIAVLSSKPDGQMLHLMAKKIEQPVVTAVRYSYEPGSTECIRQAIAVTGGTLVLTSCYLEEGELLVRLFEASGQAGETELHVGFPFTKVWASTLIGEPSDNCSVEYDPATRRIKLSYDPWKIITLHLDSPGGERNG